MEIIKFGHIPILVCLLTPDRGVGGGRVANLGSSEPAWGSCIKATRVLPVRRPGVSGPSRAPHELL